MATILNNDPGASRDGSAGWVVAVVVLVLIVLFGLFVLPNLMNSDADRDTTQGAETGARGDLGADQGGTGSPGFNTTITTSTTTVTTDSDASASSTPR